MRQLLAAWVFAFSAAVASAQDQAAPAAAPTAADEKSKIQIIRLQGLNKVTARVETLKGPVGSVMRFGNLEIIPRSCWASPTDERPENAAMLEIREIKPGEEPELIFSGWMFSSSPALSALEHPVYDITLLACKRQTIGQKKPKKSKPAAQ